MMRFLVRCMFCLLVISLATDVAMAGEYGRRASRVAQRFANTMPWHSEYAYTPYGQPLALVVPPTAATQVRMGWGVAQTEKVHIYHQFGRSYPGDFSGDGSHVYTTPNWPSHTDQFGVNYVRGPW